MNRCSCRGARGREIARQSVRERRPEIYCNEYQKGGSGADAGIRTVEEDSGMRGCFALESLSLMRFLGAWFF